MMKRIVFLAGILLIHLSSFAQDGAHGFPVIGEPCPDFTLENIQNYHTDRVSLSDLKGKYVVLDFWHRHCSACIASFPEMDQLARKFKGQVEFFMVGLQDKKGLEGFYKELQKRYSLSIPSGIDSALFRRFVPGGSAPHILLIDKEGIVKAITAPVDEAMIRSFIADKPFDFYDISYLGNIKWRRGYTDDYERMILKEAGQLADYKIRYRSVFLDYVMNEMPKVSRYGSIDRFVGSKKQFLEEAGDLNYFYILAHFGVTAWTNRDPEYLEFYRVPIFEGKDKSEFEPDYNRWANIFWYRLYLPQERMKNKAFIMKTMQEDLTRAFGYKATVEMRDMPYWKVTATKETLEKLRTKGPVPKALRGDSADVYRFRDVPFEQALRYVFGNIYGSNYPEPVINETGFNGNIDLDFRDIFRTDFDTVRKELQRHGIVLTKEERPFKVLVIRDAK